jgi:hypothetical protein
LLLEARVGNSGAAPEARDCISGAPHHQQTLDGDPAMDEAEIDDGLIEDVLDLLNDALGG